MHSAKPKRQKPGLIFLTSTYPRYTGDSTPAFVEGLANAVSNEYRIYVLAPHDAKCKCVEKKGRVVIIRYKYSIPSMEKLAYGDGIPSNIRKSPLVALLVPFFLCAQFFSLIYLMKRTHIRQIHAHWLIPQAMIAALTSIVFPDTKIIATAHGSDINLLRARSFKMFRKWIIRHSRYTTVVGSGLKHQLEKDGATLDKVVVAPMGVDLTSRFVPSTSGQNTSRDITVLFVGRLIAQKGAQYLLREFACADITPASKLVIIGSGPEENNLKNLARTLGVSNRVDFKGPIPNARLVDFYQKADVAVLPSLVTEGLGLVAIEAMGCGVPVIASDFPSVRDYIKPGQTGLLIPPGASGALAKAIQELADNPSLRNDMGLQARDFARHHFDWQATAKTYMALYKNIVTDS